MGFEGRPRWGADFFLEAYFGVQPSGTLKPKASQISSWPPTNGDKGYATLADAVVAVPTDGNETTITMIGNDYYEDNNPITIGKNQKVILDLNGKTVSAISSKDEASALITNKGYLTIKDSGSEGCLVMLAKSPDGNFPGLIMTRLCSRTKQSQSGRAHSD